MPFKIPICRICHFAILSIGVLSTNAACAKDVAQLLAKPFQDAGAASTSQPPPGEPLSLLGAAALSGPPEVKASFGRSKAKRVPVARTGSRSDSKPGQRSSSVASGTGADPETVAGAAQATGTETKSEGDPPPTRKAAEPDAWSRRPEGDALEDDSPATADESRATKKQSFSRPLNATALGRSKVIGDAKVGLHSAPDQQSQSANASQPARRGASQPRDPVANTPVARPMPVPPPIASGNAVGHVEQMAKPIAALPSSAPIEAPICVGSSPLRDSPLSPAATAAALPRLVTVGDLQSADATLTSLGIPPERMERRPAFFLAPYADAPRPRRESLPGRSQMPRDARLDQSAEDSRVLELAAFKAQVAASAAAILRHAMSSGF